MTINLLQEFINTHDYDVRKTLNGRWIDQKCTLDTVCFVADCVINFIGEDEHKIFKSPQIWHADYSVKNVQCVFSKPDPNRKTTLDEYNKFYRQQLKMFAAAGILKENGKQGAAILFSVERKDILEFIAIRERNAFDFLCLYIEKTLKDSGLWDAFASFFDEQSKETFEIVKNTFYDFCIKYTPIKNDDEPGRIFAKVLNPLACKYHKKGTIKGYISSNIITYQDLMYNRTNWRDVGKDKNIARRDYAPETDNTDFYSYRINKAIRYLRKYNDKYNLGKSEVMDKLAIGSLATHIHHIFPKNQFKEIADYVENLIALTSGQHLQLAHPDGNTQIIDSDYQYVCLMAKTESIRKNLCEGFGEPNFYSFEDFMYVLDTGFHADYFHTITTNDFSSVINGIDVNIKL